MIIERIKEFFRKIFKFNDNKLLSEKSESIELINEKESDSLKNDKDFVEKVDLIELHEKKREEIEKEYDIDNKDDFFKVYNMVKESKLSLDSLSLKWVIKIDLMMQQEIAMMNDSGESL